MSDDESQGERRSGLYRLEAVEEARAPKRRHGDVLRVAPLWLHAASWLVAAFLLTVVFMALVVRVNEYSRGPALIEASAKTVITSAGEGRVLRVVVSAGEVVASGQPLVQLSPADSEPVRSPTAGRVGAIRVREGQSLTAGAEVLTLLEPQPTFRVLALLPASSLPDLQVGMPMRIALTGYANASQSVPISALSQQILGRTEAQRLLGDATELGPFDAPMTLVEAKLGGEAFELDGRALQFHDGMPASAQVSVRQVRLLTMLAPWLGGAL